MVDIEGADSVDRWEERQVYEKRTALLGLLLSDILIVNLWVQDVGRYTASNYDLIKTVLEINV